MIALRWTLAQRFCLRAGPVSYEGSLGNARTAAAPESVSAGIFLREEGRLCAIDTKRKNKLCDYFMNKMLLKSIDFVCMLVYTETVNAILVLYAHLQRVVCNHNNYGAASADEAVSDTAAQFAGSSRGWGAFSKFNIR